MSIASPVLVLGAGPVGLGAALELARFGVPSIVIEKHPGTSWHPKTRNFNTRTMEVAMGWGPLVYQRLRAIDTPPGWKSPIRFLESAIGQQFGQIESKGFSGPGPDVSPAEPTMSSQELIEAILLDAARASGLVSLRFETEALRLLEGGDDDAQRVRLEVRDRSSGAIEVLEAAALVAADGAASTIRTQLGLALEGHQGLAHIINCYFRADIETPMGDRRGVLLFVSNPQADGVLQPLDAQGRWLCQITVPEAEWSLDVFTKERAAQWIRAAAGIDDLDVEVFSIGLWKLNATVVEQMVQGRVVICGDAAHQFPPTGGLGVNTGLQGMHNVMWKLALHVRGLADWGLVRTYDAERRPVSKRITAQSLENSFNVSRIKAAAMQGGESGLDPEQIVRESHRYGNHLGAEFGSVYASRAVIGDGTTPPVSPDDYSDYVPSATPGARAPHLWIGGDRAQLSTLHLFGAGFTLLAGRDATGWNDQAQALADSLGEADRALLSSYRLGHSPGLRSGAERFEADYGVGSEGAVLVRPDGHVAWRAARAPSRADELAAVLTHILGQPLVAAGTVLQVASA